MPQVGNKKFPYTPSGIRQAKQAMSRKQKFGAALTRLRSRDALRSAQADMRNQGAANQLRNQVATNARLKERAESLLSGNQRAASPQPNRRQAIASQIGQDKVYRPDRDGPKRPLPTGGVRPGRRPLGVGGMRPSRRPIRPGGPILRPFPRPGGNVRRPKPPNRRYL